MRMVRSISYSGVFAVVFLSLVGVEDVVYAAATYNVSADVEIELGGVPLEQGLISMVSVNTREWDRESGGDFPGFVAPPYVEINTTGLTQASIFAQSTGRAVHNCVDDEIVWSESANGGEVEFNIVNPTDFGWQVEVDLSGFFTSSAGVDADRSEFASTWFTVNYSGNVRRAPAPVEPGGILVDVRDETRNGDMTYEPKFYDWVTTMEFLGSEDRLFFWIPPSLNVHDEDDGEVVIEINLSYLRIGVGVEGRAGTLFCDGSNWIIATQPPSKIGDLVPQSMLTIKKLQAVFESYYRHKRIVDKVDDGAQRLRQLFARTAQAIEKNNYPLMCKALAIADDRTNGLKKPRDWVEGKPVLGLNRMIRQYEVQLGCKAPKPIKKLPPKDSLPKNLPPDT